MKRGFLLEPATSKPSDEKKTTTAKTTTTETTKTTTTQHTSPNAWLQSARMAGWTMPSSTADAIRTPDTVNAATMPTTKTTTTADDTSKVEQLLQDAAQSGRLSSSWGIQGLLRPQWGPLDPSKAALAWGAPMSKKSKPAEAKAQGGNVWTTGEQKQTKDSFSPENDPMYLPRPKVSTPTGLVPMGLAAANTDSPKLAANALYGKEFGGVNLTESSFFYWSNQGPAHELFYTCLFVCPVTYEIFPAQRHETAAKVRQTEVWVSRRRRAQPKTSNNETTATEDTDEPKTDDAEIPGDKIPIEMVWYSKKKEAAHGASAIRYDCFYHREQLKYNPNAPKVKHMCLDEPYARGEGPHRDIWESIMQVDGSDSNKEAPTNDSEDWEWNLEAVAPPQIVQGIRDFIAVCKVDNAYREKRRKETEERNAMEAQRINTADDNRIVQQLDDMTMETEEGDDDANLQRQNYVELRRG